MSDDLAIGRRLAAAGIPVFAVPPHTVHPTGFALPARWQHATANPQLVDQWREGWALLAVMGHGIDLVDIDPRNGGSLDDVTWLTGDVVGAAATPSGGVHLFVPSIGLPSRDNFLPGIDFKGGTRDGRGRGFAFIAPTIRVSKVTGQPGTYRWTALPDIDKLGKPGPGKLVELVAAARNGTPVTSSRISRPAPVTPASPWDNLPETIPVGERHATVHRLASALRGRGGVRLVDAIAHMDVVVWPKVAADPSYSIDDFHRDITDVFNRYPDGNGDTATTEAADPGVYLQRASDIKAQQVVYLDEGLIPLHVVTLVTGLDGVGKSTILYQKTALLTRGELPGLYRHQPVDVVVASSEDHPGSVIVPRLVAANADLARVHVVRVRREGLDGEITLPDDLDAVAEQVTAVNARLLILDPLMAHLSLRVDSHKVQHIRSVLAPLARLAEEGMLAVAAVVHFNGTPSNDVRTRISGSKALRDASRSVLVCGPDPVDETRFVLVQDKNSFGPRAVTGHTYTIAETVVTIDGTAFTTSRVDWGERVPITSRGLLTGAADPEERSERDLARDVIVEQLAGGQKTWAVIQEALKAEGVSERTGCRARDELKREGAIDKRKTAGPWVWEMTLELGHVELGQGGGQVPNPLQDKGSEPNQLELGHIQKRGQVGQVQAEATDPGSTAAIAESIDLDDLAARAAAGEPGATALFDQLLNDEQRRNP